MNRIYKFWDGLFRFYTAHYGSWRSDIRIIFRVRVDRKPGERAAEKNIKSYDRLLPSTQREIKKWMKGHPSFPSASYF